MFSSRIEDLTHGVIRISHFRLTQNGAIEQAVEQIYENQTDALILKLIFYSYHQPKIIISVSVK